MQPLIGLPQLELALSWAKTVNDQMSRTRTQLANSSALRDQNLAAVAESAERDLNPIAMSVDKAARLAGVGRGYLYQQISRGHLRARKAGRRTLITLVDLVAWLQGLPTCTQFDCSTMPAGRSKEAL